MKSLSEVLYAESDGDNTANLIPIDGRFAQQWNLHNTIVPNADIHAEAAWDIFTGNPNSIIAIIDAGVDVNHNDLAAKIDGGDNTFLILHDPVVGDYSHGSHVAGIAAAVTNNNNNNGVAGVDWQARIYPRYVIGNNTGDAGIAQAINDAVNFSPNVWTFNNSWGLTQGKDAFGNDIPGRYSTTVRSAFANVYRHDRVSCVAMGNYQAYSGGIYANQVSFPAGFNSEIIAVGATDDHDNIANFSANSPYIDVSAPGVNITSTNFNNGYVVLSGTSMATPHVSGLASLLKGFNTNLDNDDIEQIIRLTADDVNAATNPGFDNQMGSGRINAQRALQSLQAPNTLQHLSTTGGTIFSTTGSMTRIFLGVPGLADAAYIVKRSEVRKAITLPAICNTIGVWGRGVSTTGYREEQGSSFGEGICEIVPGTLTNTSATLRTWIYEVWSINGQYLGFFPRTANNVVFQYTVLGIPTPNTINGDVSFCTTSHSYSIPNLPAGASVTWSVSPSGIVTINSPNATTTTLTRVTSGAFTLTATITNVCGGTPIIITRQSIQAGDAGISSINLSWLTSCFGNSQLVQLDAVPSTAGTNWHWSVNTGSQFAFTSGTTSSSVQGYVTGSYAILLLNYTGTSCNTQLTGSVTAYTTCNHGLVVSPNPTNNIINVSLNSSSTDNTLQTRDNALSITRIEITNQLGTLIKEYKYATSANRRTLDISALKSGVYFIKAFDGSQWQSASFIKQ